MPETRAAEPPPAELLFLKICSSLSSGGALLLQKEHEIFMSDFTN